MTDDFPYCLTCGNRRHDGACRFPQPIEPTPPGTDPTPDHATPEQEGTTA